MISVKGIIESFHVHFVGTETNRSFWEWVYLGSRIFILLTYILLHSIVLIARRIITSIITCPIYRRVKVFKRNFFKNVPIVGKFKICLLDKWDNFIMEQLLPFFEKILQTIELCFQLYVVELLFKNNENVQIFFTEDSEPLELFDGEEQLSTLLIANHRSVNDYALVNYLIQDESLVRYTNKREVINKLWKENRTIVPILNFISWGKIFNFPKISLLKNIVLKDENAYLKEDEFEDHLMTNNNQVYAIFPEINILTTELGFVQRKLNQEYIFVTKFYNVLYPRFRNFITVVNCFGFVQNIKKMRHNYIFNETKQYLNEKFDKILLPTKKDDRKKNEAQVSMILSDSGLFEKRPEDSSSRENKPVNRTSLSNFKLNPYFYDLTIVYYRPIITSKGHNHTTGNMKIHKGYQLQQIVPSFLDLLMAKKPQRDMGKTTTKTKTKNHIKEEETTPTDPVEEIGPIIIMVQISKCKMAPLLPLKDKKLERWLEQRWGHKDKLINIIDSKIEVK
ncbi:Mum3p NDAI_0E00650 [Naumovozyma dairenensis CBS 421]|uniref:Uncharacterized protein n=1 Tax=Naumovozyma dairenensis (strain ATCC 10597 / BCRC 20456 / CBS 421 / NBRC 0211 / NRRL Y-12639) TaxID=1071378 RepID=G0WAW1_NAUDC|nr:hypothetical protein NDAI_0E00650 [Naumovozyma dairenensis CBS 421]CCD24881.1 hypothetical protein NDAI_0E00650 [Naumovozyma dairenensis CBS 421]